MDDYKRENRIPTLTRDNTDLWFRQTKLKLQSKGVFYTIESTAFEYARISRYGSSTVPTPTTETSSQDHVDRLAADFEKLGGTWNVDKKKEYEKDEATARFIIISTLSEDDQMITDEYESAKNVWHALQKRYNKTNESTANIYMLKITNFEFSEEQTLDSAWAKLREYRRKLVAANSVMKDAYPDEALFLILTKSLPSYYKATTDSLRIQKTMPVDEKLQLLYEVEADNKPEESAHAAFQQRKSSSKYIPPERRNSYRKPRYHSSSESDSSRLCFFCDGKHYLRECPRIDLARILLRQHDKEKKERSGRSDKSRSRQKSSSRIPHKVHFEEKSRSASSYPEKKKTRGYTAHDHSAESSHDSASDSDNKVSNDETESCHLSKDDLSNVFPSSWPADTGASSHMSDQLDSFRSLATIKTRQIQVGGGVMYARKKGTAELTCADGSSMLLKDVLFVPGLGVNLLSARKLCQSGLRGAFDTDKMYFKDGKKTIVEATMKKGLYVVSHVANGHEEKAFLSTDVEMVDRVPVSVLPESTKEKLSNQSQSNSERELTDKDKKRYMLFHRRFAHLGPKKIGSLHKVTTLEKRILTPTDSEICEICALSKMRNKFPKQLSKWKSEPLELIQFDIAGPFPESLQGNRYFLLIIDNYSRKEWTIPFAQKSDAIDELRRWKVSIERQTQKQLKAARSDNAPELLKTVSRWQTEEGVQLQSTTIASSHQNGLAERNIQTAEGNMRALLQDAQLPLEFWDEALNTDTYLRNRTDTGPKVDEKRMSPEEAFTGTRPSIDHVRVWGSKCYFYEDRKALQANERHDKLVNPGRVGVFVGYSETTTKHLRVYSPEHGRTIIRSVVRVDENIRGGEVDLRLRVAIGPQGTPNTVPDRRSRGRPKKQQEALAESNTTPQRQSSIAQVVIPFDAELARSAKRKLTETISDRFGEIPNDSGIRTNSKDAGCSGAVRRSDASGKSGASAGTDARSDARKSSDASTSSDAVGGSDARGISDTRESSDAHVTPDASINAQGISDARAASAASGGTDARGIPDASASSNAAAPPRYFTRSKRKRLDSNSSAEDERFRKIAKAMIALLEESDNLDSDEALERAYPATEVNGINIPKTYKEACNDLKWNKQWKAAMAEELLSLHSNGTWKEVVPPRHANLVTTKWVYTIKTKPDGSIDRFKARLVARGFSQVHGEDYTESFAPTVRMDTLRIFLAIVAANDLECSHFDIKNAFTESHLDEEIYLAPPDGVLVKRGCALQVLRSLYGLKQAARDWNKLIKGELLSWGFIQSLADPCLFVYPQRNLQLLVYVDDIAAAAKDKREIAWFYRKLSGRFNAKNLGEIEKILGVRITRDRRRKAIELDQEEYLNKVLDKYGITKATHTKKKIPCADYESLYPANDNDTFINDSEYRQAIGHLMYAMILTRPDMAFVLGKLSQYMSKPTERHGHAVKYLMRYLRSSVKQRLRYGPGGASKHASVYSDADWASDKTDRKSVSGHVTMLYGGPVSWSSKKQRSVATSSCESEYMAMANCAKQGQWVGQILRDMNCPGYIGKDPNNVQMFGDNQGAIALTKNPHLHERSKHIDVAYHFIRDLVDKKRITIEYVPTTEMPADGFTKPLQRVAFERFTDLLGLTRVEQETIE